MNYFYKSMILTCSLITASIMSIDPQPSEKNQEETKKQKFQQQERQERRQQFQDDVQQLENDQHIPTGAITGAVINCWNKFNTITLKQFKQYNEELGSSLTQTIPHFSDVKNKAVLTNNLKESFDFASYKKIKVSPRSVITEGCLKGGLLGAILAAVMFKYKEIGRSLTYIIDELKLEKENPTQAKIDNKSIEQNTKEENKNKSN